MYLFDLELPLSAWSKRWWGRAALCLDQSSIAKWWLLICQISSNTCTIPAVLRLMAAKSGF